MTTLPFHRRAGPPRRSTQFSVRIPLELQAQLERYCQREDISQSEAARRLLEVALCVALEPEEDQP